MHQRDPNSGYAKCESVAIVLHRDDSEPTSSVVALGGSVLPNRCSASRTIATDIASAVDRAPQFLRTRNSETWVRFLFNSRSETHSSFS